MNLIEKTERAIKRIIQSDPRLDERKESASTLRAKFDILLGGSPVRSCRNLLGSVVAPLPVEVGALGIEVLVVKGLANENEYFCSVVGDYGGFGYTLKNTRCRIFPITVRSLARKIDFGAENKDALGKDLQRLAFGHRLLDVLLDVNTRNPDVFREGYGLAYT